MSRGSRHTPLREVRPHSASLFKVGTRPTGKKKKKKEKEKKYLDL